jgi:catechol 2,3-dioxygenase
LNDFQIDPKTDIGHVHLKVSDLERAEAFYVGVLGMTVTARVPGALFVSFGDYHHDIGLNTWRSGGGGPPPQGTTGLFHFAIRVPTRKQLARVVKRLIEAGVPIGGASDHGVSEAIYLNDPDGNGIEIYRDRDRSEWHWHGDQVDMPTEPLDTKSLMAELDS